MTISIDAHAHHDEPMEAVVFGGGSLDSTARLRLTIGATFPAVGTQHSITLYVKGEHHDTLVKIAELLNTCSPVPARTPR